MTVAANTKEKRISFEQFLVDQKYLTAKQLASVHLEETANKQTLEASILQLKLMDEERLTRALAAYFHLPYADLRNQNISKDALSVISQETLENYKFIPFAREGNLLRIALTNPSDLRALEALGFLAEQSKYRIELYLISKSSYQAALRKVRTASAEVGEALAVMREKEQKEEAPKPAPSEAPVKIAQEAPIAKIVDVILRHAIEARASDVHIEPQENDLRIRYRIDGVLQSSLVVPKVVHPAIISRIKILSNLKIDEQRLPQDGRFHMDVERRSIDFRVSTLPNVNGEKVVMRILDKSGGIPSLEDLGLGGTKLARFRDSISRPHGMILVTGPTGSGKSTTLYAALNILNRIGVNIVTLEDPVEYFIPGVNQSQINPDIGLTFASGLRSILRQDPNIIMVGEIRDHETAELAVHSALTGHLVFSTLHTNDAVGAIPRLIDMGIESFLLTASVNLVMAQRLVRKICASCRKETAVLPEIRDMVKTELRDLPADEVQGLDLKNIKLFQGKGCARCGNSGYAGRIAIFEVMPLTDELKALTLNRESYAKLQEQAKRDGMIAMKQDGLLKALKGITTMEEVMRVTKE